MKMFKTFQITRYHDWNFYIFRNACKKIPQIQGFEIRSIITARLRETKINSILFFLFFLEKERITYMGLLLFSSAVGFIFCCCRDWWWEMLTSFANCYKHSSSIILWIFLLSFCLICVWYLFVLFFSFLFFTQIFFLKMVGFVFFVIHFFVHSIFVVVWFSDILEHVIVCCWF